MSRLQKLLGVAVFLCLNAQAQDSHCSGEGEALAPAHAVLQSSPLIDGHNDMPWLIREVTGGAVAAFDLVGGNIYETDIPKLRAGLVGGPFWSVWIPGETALVDYGRIQMEQIDIARRIISTHPDTFDLALTASDIGRVFETGKIASLLGMEGGYALYNSLGVMRTYYDLGVRDMTLVHNVTLAERNTGIHGHYR